MEQVLDSSAIACKFNKVWLLCWLSTYQCKALHCQKQASMRHCRLLVVSTALPAGPTPNASTQASRLRTCPVKVEVVVCGRKGSTGALDERLVLLLQSAALLPTLLHGSRAV